MEIQGSMLARNTTLNLVGQLAPLAVGLATIPYIVRGLGVEGFGILSIAWVFLNFASLLDLGLGRATTKFVAECLGRGEIHELPGLIWTSLGLQVLFGAGSGLLLAAFAHPLVYRLLKVSDALADQTALIFFIIAASLPLVLATNSLRGVLEAAQRFDLVNYVKIPANVSVFLLPVIGLLVGLQLPGIVLLLVLARFGTTLAYLVLCFKLVPDLPRGFSFDSKAFRPLLTYGGWVMVSNVVSPMLAYFDRFLIGSLLSMAAVGYYTAPFEAINRLSILPGSLAVTLFPAFSSLSAGGAMKSLEELHARAVKALLLLVGPVVFVVMVFAREILQLWLGHDFAEKSTLVLQILAVGVLVNSLAYIPYSLLQGIGRPDLTAQFHLLELPVYVVLGWFLVPRMGITGAALASTLRLGLDAVLLFAASWQLRFVSTRTFAKNGLLRGILGVSAFALALSLTYLSGAALLTRVVLVALLVPLFALGAWSFALDEIDRGFLTLTFGQVVDSVRRAR